MLRHVMIELNFPGTDAHAYELALKDLSLSGFVAGGPSQGARIALGGHTIVIGVFDEAALDGIVALDPVVAVHDDPELAPFSPADGNTKPTTKISDVRTVAKKFMGNIWAGGHHGEGVRIAICDSGIDSAPLSAVAPPLNLAGGWTSLTSNFGMGEDVAPVPHGTMVAYDALAFAPGATIVDAGLLKPFKDPPFVDPNGVTQPAAWTWRLSAAMAAYDSLINTPGHGPLVLCNSWGMRDPEVPWSKGVVDYARNPAHPFTRKVVEAISKGIIVVFAAGNCGSNGGNPYSSKKYSGPKKSIWGANGHPWVITVGAADPDGKWMGYSSEGPAALAPGMVKPDICGISQYSGYLDTQGFKYPDAGTSAAAPTVAGGLAVLKQKYPWLTQDVAAHVLRMSAVHPKAPGTTKSDSQYGFGVVDFDRADQMLALI